MPHATCIDFFLKLKRPVIFSHKLSCKLNKKLTDRYWCYKKNGISEHWRNNPLFFPRDPPNLTTHTATMNFATLKKKSQHYSLFFRYYQHLFIYSFNFNRRTISLVLLFIKKKIIVTLAEKSEKNQRERLFKLAILWHWYGLHIFFADVIDYISPRIICQLLRFKMQKWIIALLRVICNSA